MSRILLDGKNMEEDYLSDKDIERLLLKRDFQENPSVEKAMQLAAKYGFHLRQRPQMVTHKTSYARGAIYGYNKGYQDALAGKINMSEVDDEEFNLTYRDW